MKKIYLALSILLLTASSTQAEVLSRQLPAAGALGTPATSSDGILTYDASAAPGSQITQRSYTGFATDAMGGNGAWIDLGPVVSLKGVYANDLAAAVAGIGATPTVLVCNDDVVIPDGTTVSLNINTIWEPRPGCKVNEVAGGGVETFSIGKINCPASVNWVGDGVSIVFSSLVPEIYPQWFGAVGDGTTDDSAAFQEAQAAVTNSGGGKIVVPYTADGYVIGDGTNSATASTNCGIVVTDNTTWKGINNVKLIHGAKTATGNYLFDVGDCDNVLIEGFEIDGQAVAMTDQARVGVSFHDVVSNIKIRDLYLYDFANFAIQYADVDTDPASAYFDNIQLDGIRIDGVTGVTGAGSGIDIFPRSQNGNYPASTNFSIRNSVIDVSNGTTDTDQHGPQPLKFNNVDGVDIANVRLVGGNVASLILANGTMNATVDAEGSMSDLGLVVDTGSNTCDSRTQKINVKNWKYNSDSATNGNLIGLQFKGALFDIDLQSVLLTNSSMMIYDNYTNDMALGDGLGAAARNWTFDKISIDNGYIDIADATNALQPDLVGLSINSVYLAGGASSSAGKFSMAPADWSVTGSYFGSIICSKTDNDCVTVNGSNNVFNYILSIDGNPDDDDNAWVVNDTGNYNVFNYIGIAGSSNEMDLFYNKSDGSGAKVKEIAGTPIDANGIRAANMESADVILGGNRVISKSFDLSGAADSEILFYADTDYYIASIVFLYTEASSSDAGVAVQVGDTASATSFLDVVSVVSQPVGNIDLYQNTTGTNSFSNRDLVKGQYLRVASAGGKTGTGAVTVVINLIEAD